MGLAMNRNPEPNPPTGRSNRRGCFIIAAVLVLLVAVLAYVGFSADPIDEFKASIPTIS